MYNDTREPNFNQHPYIEANQFDCFSSYDEIGYEIKQKLNQMEQQKKTIVIDCYHGVNQSALLDNLITDLQPDEIIHTEDALLSAAELFTKFEKFIVPQDRSYGAFAVGTAEEYFSKEKLEDLKNRIRKQDGLIIIYGVAAGIVCEHPDVLLYANFTFEAVMTRFAAGGDNWGAENADEEFLKKQKRYIFLDHTILAPHKTACLQKADYVLNLDDADHPVMLRNSDVKTLIKHASSRPFQLVPQFTKAIWGGKWAQKVLGVCKDWPNVGWVLTGHMSMQKVTYKLKNGIFSIDAQDMLYYEPKRILGASIYYKWGYRCPLTINYLDTWEGGNLSLQVHPTASYGIPVFNARAGHHESYYIMDTTERSAVYLGLKEGTKVADMVSDLKKAEESGEFDAAKYVNRIPVKKHQHVFIPSGTVHSSAEGTCVLEIDQYTYATFKLFDWGRVDYDGRPRPVNIDHGQHCIQEDFQGEFVYDHLIAKQPQIAHGDGWECDDTSPIDYEPMDIKRYWFTKALHLECEDAIQILILVEGEEALIESLDGTFEPFVIHYAEATFIPAAVGQFILRPYGASLHDKLAVIKVSYPHMA
ncbi:class I mannose-6-phosphate isomerase [[Clostridium] innocuum]|nr:class I mannose-6-phosphate isomerase [[Clostridium] innocuum]MCR0443759.1 class I mannose-6-phosphate isomerase [[Clostridium] innocuum]